MWRLRYALALAIAACAHFRQKDKIGDAYFWHCWRVGLSVAPGPARVVGILHDVIEDHPRWKPIIRWLFPDDVYSALLRLCHPYGQPYYQYIDNVKRNPLAREVKIADVRDNGNNFRLARIKDGREADRLHVKYRSALARLTDGKDLM